METEGTIASHGSGVPATDMTTCEAADISFQQNGEEQLNEQTDKKVLLPMALPVVMANADNRDGNGVLNASCPVEMSTICNKSEFSQMVSDQVEDQVTDTIATTESSLERNLESCVNSTLDSDSPTVSGSASTCITAAKLPETVTTNKSRKRNCTQRGTKSSTSTNQARNLCVRFEGNQSKRWDGKEVLIDYDWIKEIVDVTKLVPGNTVTIPWPTAKGGDIQNWRGVVVNIDGANVSRKQNNFYSRADSSLTEVTEVYHKKAKGSKTKQPKAKGIAA